jgi:hypothetical protein
MISFLSRATLRVGMKEEFQIAMISILHFCSRFDPVKVHCILPDRGYLPALNGRTATG